MSNIWVPRAEYSVLVFQMGPFTNGKVDMLEGLRDFSMP